MFNTLCVLFWCVYITLTAGQSTVSEGDDTCDVHHAVMDRIAAMENMMSNLISQTESKISTRLDTIETEMKQMKKQVNLIGVQLGGRVTMLRRQDGSISFERNWADYKSGFGDIGGDGEMWLGLDKLHQLTSENECSLNVTMATWDGKSFWAYYSMFTVGPESDNYRLSVSGYDVSSTAGDSFSYHNNMAFSTIDRDNNGYPRYDCTAEYKAGWWYRTCHYCNPTGWYLEGGVNNNTGIAWKYIPGYHVFYSFKKMTFTLIRCD